MVSYEEFQSFLYQSWQDSGVLNDLPSKLKSCQAKLKSWAGKKFDHLCRKLVSLRRSLNHILNSNEVVHNFQRIVELEHDIDRLSLQEEIHWKQRSRVNWLGSGDRNTKFFHATASEQRRKNHIKGLFSDSGEWRSDEKGIACIFLDYFHSLFLTSHPPTQVLQEVLALVEPCVSDVTNAVLTAPFTSAEVRRAVFDPHPSKAPGPDGFSALFFQKSWPFLGDDVTEAALNILNDIGDIKGWNVTIITLIPKVKEPQFPKDFIPISLCNTCYKIIAKTISNRFRPALSHVIDQSQSAFVSGRLITAILLLVLNVCTGLENIRKEKLGMRLCGN